MKCLSKDRYDETFAGEDDVCVKISEYPPPLGFYHIWVWRSSWSCDLNILYTFWLIYHKESSHVI